MNDAFLVAPEHVSMLLGFFLLEGPAVGLHLNPLKCEVVGSELVPGFP
jgi:hypothetical protein